MNRREGREHSAIGKRGVGISDRFRDRTARAQPGGLEGYAAGRLFSSRVTAATQGLASEQEKRHHNSDGLVHERAYSRD